MHHLIGVSVITNHPELLKYMKDKSWFYAPVQNAIQEIKRCYYLQHAKNIHESPVTLTFDIHMFGMSGQCSVEDFVPLDVKFSSN